MKNHYEPLGSLKYIDENKYNFKYNYNVLRNFLHREVYANTAYKIMKDSSVTNLHKYVYDMKLSRVEIALIIDIFKMHTKINREKLHEELDETLGW
ncbi:MAG TPA: hypothetical protein VKR58_15150, partial [Aquella sp.]|nr:hypothetical protein [Aquella sp.]